MLCDSQKDLVRHHGVDILKDYDRIVLAVEEKKDQGRYVFRGKPSGAPGTAKNPTRKEQGANFKRWTSWKEEGEQGHRYRNAGAATGKTPYDRRTWTVPAWQHLDLDDIYESRAASDTAELCKETYNNLRDSNVFVARQAACQKIGFRYNVHWESLPVPPPGTNRQDFVRRDWKFFDNDWHMLDRECPQGPMRLQL